MNTPKNCETCKYGTIPGPCSECSYLNGDQYFFLWEPKEKEEKKMDDGIKKTKRELLEEIEQKNAEIKALKEELNKTERYDIYLAGAKEVRGMVDAYIEAGFTEEQAFELIKMFLSNSQSIVPSGKSRYEFRR